MGLTTVQRDCAACDYINDLQEVCKQFVNVFLFADDAKLYKHVINDDNHQLLQKSLNAFQVWSDRWSLKFTISSFKRRLSSFVINIGSEHFSVN